MSDPDADDMLRVQQGDAKAFERLVSRWLRPLASFFHRLGADPALAEDCASEVFYKVYKSRDAYEARAKFTTYLFSIARHHWIDVVRHRGAGPRTVSADVEGSSEGGNEGPISARLEGREGDPALGLSSQELAKALREAVASLPDEHREVFALAQNEGLKYQEIAEILGIPVGTVKSRMHAAMRMLRETLARGGFEP